MRAYQINDASEVIKSVCFFTNYGDDPCAHLRLRGPMRHLGIKVIDGKTNGKINPECVSQGDVVVIQRDIPRDLPAYERIIQLAHHKQKPVIFDIDDLLLLMPEEHPERINQHYIEALLPISQAIYEADLVTTTTPFLQNWLTRFNNNVILLPNYFDDELWELRKPDIKHDQETPLIIGYMGSESHLPDVEFISPVIVELINRFPDRLNFHFWGVKPPEVIADFPQVKWIPAVSYEYDEFAAYFQTQSADIFIAPLLDNDFNRAKSPLKFFEYTSLGVPGVYSKLETFDQTIIHGHNGLLASSTEEWQEFLIMLIQDSELREKLARNAQETIRAHWLLSKNTHRWREAYQKIKINFSQQGIVNRTGYDLVKSLNHQYFSLIGTMKDTNTSLNHEIDSLMRNLNEKEIIIQSQNTQINFLSNELSEIKISKAWKLMLFLRKIRYILIPADSTREKFSKYSFGFMRKLRDQVRRKHSRSINRIVLDTENWLSDCFQVTQHTVPVDIIVCVHNALEDVRECFNSIEAHTAHPYSVIIVDDGSHALTRDYLKDWAELNSHYALIRNETALGYTRAANVGMKASQAEIVVLLNSDTIVTPGWIDRLCRALLRENDIGVVGPLSNTASWQSIPKLSEEGDWAINHLPEGVSQEEMGRLIAKHSACIHPAVPLLNGFCMLIRKALIDEIGYFDEINFGQGYGEEDDFILRAGRAGWKIAIADDAYVYHSQSKSYTSDRRHKLQKISGQKLLDKHGQELVTNSVAIMHPNRVMEGIRARSSIMLEREAYIQKGRELYENKRVLFVLPVLDAGGGANVILDEARCMRKMGVEVEIFNLSQNKNGFLKNYAHVDIPFIFGEVEDLPVVSTSFDAVVASANYSVPWFQTLHNLETHPKLGYYIQGFEPLMYPNGSKEFMQALASYTMIKGIKRFTKTQWTRNEVLNHTGADSGVVGISVNYDLFRPRDMVTLGAKPVKIVAMVRPGSPYRSPEMTTSILRQISLKYRKDVDICFFGAEDVCEVVDERLLDFDWQQLGKLTQIQVASMMSKADIFTDFSSHQAMGLSALEAMAAGCSVIVPKNGGAIEFVTHHVNGMIADTTSIEASTLVLEELIENDLLRKQIQINGINDIVQYHPERTSYNILRTLFTELSDL